MGTVKRHITNYVVPPTRGEDMAAEKKPTTKAAGMKKERVKVKAPVVVTARTHPNAPHNQPFFKHRRTDSA